MQLQNYVKGLGERANQDLIQLVDLLVGKMSSTMKRENVQSVKKSEMGVVLQTAESMRRSQAQKRLKSRQQARAMSIDQVSKVMDKRLQKLNIYVQNAGVETQGTVSENLVRINLTATPLMGNVSAEEQSKMVQNFKTESATILQELAKSGNLSVAEVNKYRTEVKEIAIQLNHTDPTRRTEAINQIGIKLSDASIESEKRKASGSNLPPQKFKAPPAPAKLLTSGQVSKFLESSLTTLFEKVTEDGSLTDDGVSKHLSQFAGAAQEVMIEIPVERKAEMLNEFKNNTNKILDDIVEKGYLSNDKIDIFVNEIHTDLHNLNDASEQQRADLISQIGITLTQASQDSARAQGTHFDTTITSAFANIPSVGNGPKAMTQDQVAGYLKNYMKKLYERVKVEGALTQDKIAEYLAQFANVSQEIVVDIPVERRREVIDDFKVSTNIILQTIFDEGKVPEADAGRLKAEIEEKLEELETPDLDIRIEIVSEIGDKLAEASIQSVQEEVIDEAFLRKAIIPYGFDDYATKISAKDFFSFPFGERKGPPDDDWFMHHMKYLNIAVENKKLEEAAFDKISKGSTKLPSIKYKKYFNIFPAEQLEETTFLAVLDLWQNKALEKLRI